MNKFNNNSGVTLIEILIGIVISVIIMAAMFASYTAINNSYSQVTDKAKASQSGRNIMGMMIRDIRQAGFKYFEDTIANSDEPVRITKNRGGVDADIDSPCDHIRIVFGDVSYDANGDEIYERYRVTYFCQESEIELPDGTNEDTEAIYKQKEKLDNSGDWQTNINGSYGPQLITDYIEDLIFVPKDIDGKEIDPAPTNSENEDKIYDIRSVEVALMTRSVKDFYKSDEQLDGTPRSIIGIEDNGNLMEDISDRFLRETFVMSVSTRNIGLE